MRDYNYKEKWHALLTSEIVKKLTLIHEYKGEQRLFIEAHKDELNELVEIAKIQSTEASNRIEGISTADDRLKNLVQAKTTPRNRDESEIAGYRDVLNTIHENYDYIPINTNYLLQLHRDLYKFLGSVDGGVFKASDNIIQEMDMDGIERVRFRPVAAWETPASIDELCKAFSEAKNEADPLLLSAMFVLDFLCIHPFNDGNGRMSRLLTLLLLYQSGFVVGKYISIEKIIEESKETYYEALQDSSIGWHDNENDYKLFTCGHFDLVICDEAHRSIYNKYRDIFSYFDAPLVGLTATPKDEIDKNTYEVFELENGVPTYGYDLAQAVKDGYLVDYISVESKLKFIEQGIVYDELSEEDKKAYEETFEDEHGELPESIGSSELNTWIFNEDTIKQVLNILMTDGIKIDYGQKLGKTIIFAKNHNHAEKILEVFNKEYPHLPDYAKVIDNYMTYAQSAIDEFSDPKKMPQIAISVDMLDTGIDVPEILNLVFFKKVMSKAKFWQMIGRGTRLCPGLLDGENKQKFYIFDFCGNFEFFRMNKGKATANMIALQGAIFNLKFEISYKLQDIEYQVDRLIAYRKALVKQMSEKVQELPRDNFAVRQHLKYVDLYSSESNYNALTYEDTLIVRGEVAPLILPDGDEASAVRFDALMYGIELAYLVGKKYSKARTDLYKKVAGIASVANIPEIQVQSDLINKILNTDYMDNAGINDFEEIREKLRDLMKYLPHINVRYDTNFTDELLSTEWKESELEDDELKNYKAKAEHYIRQHQDHIAIAKLKTNQPLTSTDIATLEEVLWHEVGTKQDYEHEVGMKPLGEFVREIVGLDMNAAKEAFSEYLTNTSLDSRQIYFVNQIVEYIVHNGMMKDFSVLQESPFTDRGSVVEIFTDLNVWMGIRKVIETINANAAA